jgi:NAD+ synthase
LCPLFQNHSKINFLVAGCAHKSEDMVGLFVKFGVDDIADIMPLKTLYRSHILQLAEFLGVPVEILNRTPNPDIIPGVSDKYMDILGLPCDMLDLILYGIEHGMNDEIIAAQLNLPEGRVVDIRNLIHQTEHMRSPSRSLTWK